MGKAIVDGKEDASRSTGSAPSDPKEATMGVISEGGRKREHRRALKTNG